jgi:hypothetical protein
LIKQISCNGANNGIISITNPTGGYGTYEFRLDAGAWQESGSFTNLALQLIAYKSEIWPIDLVSLF